MFLLCREIRRKPLTDLIDILDRKLVEEDDVTFEGSPSRGRGGIDQLRISKYSRRYIFHLLARLTAFTEANSGRPLDSFDKFVNRDITNPFDIEHIWADDFQSHDNIFETAQEFEDWRNHVASLLLLPADVNRSLQDKPFPEKASHYAKQNFYAASLFASPYRHQPQFEAFRTTHGLPFQSFESFGKNEQLKRRELIRALVNLVWSPARLKEFLPGHG